MTGPIKISVVIITFNEEKNIRRCIESVKPVADEILVIDSYSTDQTEKICRELKVKFMQHTFAGHIEQKNYAVDHASHDYVLSLDADEELSKTLQQSILNIKGSAAHKAFRFNRLTSYCGKWIKHCGWYPDTKIRFWKKDIGRWGGVNPHDTVVLNQGIQAKHLKGDLLHYSFHDLAQHITQMNKFSDIAAKQALERGKRTIPIIHLLFYPFFTFLKMYFLKLGFLDGYHGYLVCRNGAYYRYLKYAKLYELNKQKD